jgi:hypothetical protein
MYGMIEINGKRYIKRPQIFPAEVTITSSLQILANQRVVLPGVADFMLEGLTRLVTVAGAPVVNRPFKFKLGNTDGSVWYMAAGNGGTNDRVVDSLVFGNGAFPFPLTPSLMYGKNASILFDVEDISNTNGQTIYFGFIGSYLIPVQQ